MTQPRPARRTAPAFRPDRAAQAAGGAVSAAWWSAFGAAARRLTRRARANAPPISPRADPPPANFVRQAWREAFDKDAQAVARGLYPPRGPAPKGLVAGLREAVDLLADARRVDERRRRGGAQEAREEAEGGRGYPAYYRQNFHFQTGGWFTAESARRYEGQVEILFAGAGGAMRRRALALLAEAWRTKDHRGLAILDLACGAGGFLADLSAAFPRARLIGLDLSPAYLAEAGRRSGADALVQANAERLPFANRSLDAVTCVYLFHELPPRIRGEVAAEIARVLKPGGFLAFADALQSADEPRLARLLEVFPAYFHEPFFESYGGTDLRALFAEAGLGLIAQDRAFLTKAMLFEKT
ncbi:MAG: class I SAM-dependent methyltransferase [Caulobacteraceae bacterium]